MELLLIRHLPTRWNEQGLLQGSQDIDINPLTRAEQNKIQANIENIKQFGPQLIIVSDLNRTKQTAAAYGFLSYTIEPLVNELDFGEFEGKLKTNLTAIDAWKRNPRELILGERLIDFEKRLFQFIWKYKSYSRVLVFGHGSWIRGMISISKAGDIALMNQMAVENNTIHRLNLTDVLGEGLNK